MDSIQNSERTPRRSTRLQKMRELTPEPKQIVLGPRAMMKLNKSKQNIDENVAVSKTPGIIVTPSTPASHQKLRGRKRKVSSEHKTDSSKKKKIPTDSADMLIPELSSEKSVLSKEKSFEIADSTVQEKKDDNEKIEEITKEESNDDKQKKSLIVAEVSTREVSIIKNDTYELSKEDETKENTAIEKQSNEEKEVNKNEQEEKMNATPQLMDESIISVPDTPPAVTSIVKDATFSPEVDTSLHDSRPHIYDSIDVILNTTPIQRSKQIRTSTPLAQKLFKRETPKIPAPVISALTKVLSPKPNVDAKITEESLCDTFNGQFKTMNPLEKSILKSTRKRSLSVTDVESFIQKKVVILDKTEVMDIDSIDVKMLQSFKEEKENSIMKQNSARRHKRSLSVSDTPSSKTKIKIPNFKAIHEQQFKKMESIVDRAQRINERAMRFHTPSKALATVTETDDNKHSGPLSKIPMKINRKPLTKIPSRDNITTSNTNRFAIKRTLSVDHPVKTSKLKLPKTIVTSTLISKKEEMKKDVPKTIVNDNNLKIKVAIDLSSNASKLPQSTSQIMRKKIEDRREKNTSLYKGNMIKTTHDKRKKAETMIKGVRLNRRFELQMQHRQGESSNE